MTRCFLLEGNSEVLVRSRITISNELKPHQVRILVAAKLIKMLMGQGTLHIFATHLAHPVACE